ncbi:hypothetical protein V8C37DRAFT_381480 [Trichoderma ceciliae]
MLNKCFIYSSDRINGACRCINMPPETVIVTHTKRCVTPTTRQTVAAALANGATSTTTTATITAIVTATPPAQNLILNGDFSSGLSEWSIINSYTSAWTNVDVSIMSGANETPDAFWVSNVVNQG